MDLKIEWPQEDKAVIHLEGPFDRETVPAIRKRLLGLVRKKGMITLILDCSGISGMDTAGVAVLVEVLRAVSRRKGKLQLRHLSERDRKVIQLARLTELFEIKNHHGSEL